MFTTVKSGNAKSPNALKPTVSNVISKETVYSVQKVIQFSEVVVQNVRRDAHHVEKEVKILAMTKLLLAKQVLSYLRLLQEISYTLASNVRLVV